MARSQTRTLLLSSLLAASLTACNVAEPQPGQEIAPGVRLLARISDVRIRESSGVIASRRYPECVLDTQRRRRTEETSPLRH